MNQRLPIARSGRVAVLIRALSIAVLGGGAACTSLPPQVTGETAEPVVAEPVVEPEFEPELEPAIEAEPEVETGVPTAEAAPPSRILVLRSSDAASYAAVATVLASDFADRYEVEQVNFSALDSSALASLNHDESVAAVAIGLDAAKFAAAELTVPTVVCQIYDFEPLLSKRDAVFGVAALPPPTLQLQAWKRLAPSVASVAVFVTEDEKELIASAKHAAAEVGLALRVEYVTSDRELLYRFKRLAQELDGVWLFPDSDILSPPVLRDVFNYAQVHRVHSIVFNPSLLSWGALLSVGGSSAHIAETVAAVVDKLVAGRSSELSRITPLTAVDAKVNEDVAVGLGLRDGTVFPARSEVALK